MKKNLLLLLVLFSLFIFAGCDDPDEGDNEGDYEMISNEVKAFDYGGKEMSIFTVRANEFDYNYTDPNDPMKTPANPENTAYWNVVEKTTKEIQSKYNVKLKWVDATTASAGQTIWNHLQSVYASGQMYDIVSITGEEFPYMYSNDMVQELTDSMLSADVVELLWGGADGFQYNAIKHLDKRWGISVSNTIYDIANTTKDSQWLPILYYNKELLEDAGIQKMPGEYFLEGTWSWDVFEDMCEQVVQNLPGVSGLGDHFYGAGIQNFLGTNSTYVFDAYGNMGFYSTNAQEVYSRWNQWYSSGVVKNLTYNVNTNGAPDTWYDHLWFRDGLVAFTSGKFIQASNYWGDIDFSIVPYPFGPKSASSSDPTKIDESKYNSNLYALGQFYTVPKGKNASQCYQILAEFMGGLKNYYTHADDEDATVEEFANSIFDIGDDAALETLKFLNRTGNYYIIGSAVPSGIFRQSIRDNYNNKSQWYGQMWSYLESRRAELDPDNPNNFWKTIFGEPGNLAK